MSCTENIYISGEVKPQKISSQSCLKCFDINVSKHVTKHSILAVPFFLWTRCKTNRFTKSHDSTNLSGVHGLIDRVSNSHTNGSLFKYPKRPKCFKTYFKQGMTECAYGWYWCVIGKITWPQYTVDCGIKSSPGIASGVKTAKDEWQVLLFICFPLIQRVNTTIFRPYGLLCLWNFSHVNFLSWQIRKFTSLFVVVFYSPFQIQTLILYFQQLFPRY